MRQAVLILHETLRLKTVIEYKLIGFVVIAKKVQRMRINMKANV